MQTKKESIGEEIVIDGEVIVIDVAKTDEIVRQILATSSGDVSETINAVFKGTPHIEKANEIIHDPNEAID
jgi:hypothetical protein